MSLRWSQTLLMLVMLAGYTCSLLGLPGVSVLCYGAGGHFAVESYGECCANTHSTGNACAQTVTANSSSTDEKCFDILIQTESASTRSSQGNVEAAFLAQMHTLLPELPITLPLAVFLPTLHQAGSFSSLSLSDVQLSLRSVILLV